MFASFFRIIKFAFQDLGRNIWLTVVTLTLLILALVSVNLLIIFNVLTENFVSSVEERLDIGLDFKSEISEEQVFSIKQYLESFREVSEVIYISKEEALKSFNSRHEDEPWMIESLQEINENPFGASLIIIAENPRDYPKILERIEGPEYQNLIEVNDQDFTDKKIVINKTTEIASKVSKTGILVVIIFSLISILIIYNAIRISIYTRREEIKAMKLVGATNWFIRVPFILEGVFYGIMACLITITIIYPFLGIIQPYLGIILFDGTQFDLVSFFNENFYTIFGYQLLGAIFLNIVSSSLAVSKYLDI